MTVMESLGLIIIGVSAGVLSGMFGVGGGVIIVPSLVLLLGMSHHEAQGTSLGLMLLPIGILAAYNYYKTGNLDVRAGLIIALAFVFGGYLGSKMALSIDEVLLKRLFGIFMIIVALKLIFTRQ